MINYATLQDLDWLIANDKHVSPNALHKKIINKEMLIGRDANEIHGWLRFGFFWDSIPFMNMLFINMAMRNKGLGRQLVKFWENEMKARKYRLVMTSSQSDEDGQYFYRKSGYSDCGSFQLPGESQELIFYKRIG